MDVPVSPVTTRRFKPWPHHNTVFAQMLKFIPTCLSLPEQRGRQGHEIESLANQHHSGRRLRKMTRWTQFVAMATAQLSGRHSLRDVASNMAAQARKRYHLGMSAVSRSSLSRVNASQPDELYEALFQKLLTRCQAHAPRHKFKNKLYSLDASTIDLCLSVFPWAKFRAMLRRAQQPPRAPSSFMSGWITRVCCRPACSRQAFVAITDGKTHDITAARALSLPKDSIVVMDRGYNDYAWYNSLNNNNIYFVTRLKTNARYRVIASAGSATVSAELCPKPKG